MKNFGRPEDIVDFAGRTFNIELVNKGMRVFFYANFAANDALTTRPNIKVLHFRSLRVKA